MGVSSDVLSYIDIGREDGERSFMAQARRGDVGQRLFREADLSMRVTPDMRIAREIFGPAFCLTR